MRKLTITKINDSCWKVKGEGIEILTNTKQKAKEWKEIFKKG